MTRMQGNKMIVAFMGKTYSATEVYSYHEKWEQLMPVIEKIERIRINNGFPIIVTISGDGAAIYVNKLNGSGTKYTGKERIANTFNANYFNDYPGAIRVPKVTSVWNAVIQFIEWYNKLPASVCSQTVTDL